jgi:hypothetical protein
MRALLAALVLAVALAPAPGCKKKRPEYSRKSPADTLKSLEAALAKGRIPADLELFFVGSKDLASWRLRCKSRGCTGGELRIVGKEREDEYSATYLVDITVRGKQNVRVMQTKAPVKFVFEDGAWYIEELGEYVSVPMSPADGGAAAPGDGGAAATPRPDGGRAARPHGDDPE